MKETINLFYPTLLKEEWIKELENVFSTRWIGQGPKVDLFESLFANKFNYKYCLAVNSGTAALDLAYHLIGIQENDKVLTTVFTCTATNIPLLRRKANIEFLDIDNTLCVSYDDLLTKISKDIKAIVVVNLGGIQVDKRIFTIAKEFNIPVVIDACQSLGISENDGDYICYSFQAIKHFTTGDGGMLIVRNKETYDRAKKLRWFGIDREAKKKVDWKCIVNHQMAMDIEEPGFKYHMNDISASMGIIGLKHSDELLKHREELCNIYNEELSKKYNILNGGSYWLCTILDSDRDLIIEYLKENNIESDLVQLRNDIFQAFGGKRQNLPNMNKIENEYFYLPLHNKLSKDDVYYICNILNKWNKK